MERQFSRNHDEYLRACYCALFSAELQYDVNLLKVCYSSFNFISRPMLVILDLKNEF